MTIRERIAMPVPVSAEVLRRLGTDLLVAAQMEPNDARLVADSLVEANLRGIDSHGVVRLPHYLRGLVGGTLEPRPAMSFVRLGPGVGHLDGNCGLGQLVMQRATSEAIALAWQAGAGWVRVCHSSHCGALDYFGMQIARAGLMGIVFTHVDPTDLPFDATQPFCGTNPLCLTAPGQDGQLFCLDMPASIVSWDLLAQARLAGDRRPVSGAVAPRGRHPTVANATALTPIKQSKSKDTGLGLGIEILCALLGAVPSGQDASTLFRDVAQRRRLGGLVGAIDIARFTSLEQVQARLTELLTKWGEVPSLHLHSRVLYPGQPEELSKEQRLRDGIPVPAPLWVELEELAAAHGVDAWLTGSLSTR